MLKDLLHLTVPLGASEAASTALALIPATNQKALTERLQNSPVDLVAKLAAALCQMPMDQEDMCCQCAIEVWPHRSRVVVCRWCYPTRRSRIKTCTSCWLMWLAFLTGVSSKELGDAGRQHQRGYGEPTLATTGSRQESLVRNLKVHSKVRPWMAAQASRILNLRGTKLDSWFQAQFRT